MLTNIFYCLNFCGSHLDNHGNNLNFAHLDQNIGMDFNKILQKIEREVSHLYGTGAVANYIPALANVNPRKFGMAIATVDGQHYSIGDSGESFSIQSISKLITLVLYIRKNGLELGNRVGVEPSGNPFNSLVQLEYEKGIPRNPFINAGALVITDGILSLYPEARSEIIRFIRKLSNNDQIDFDYEIAASERNTGFRNAALANFIKSYSNIHNDVETVLDAYYYQCSIRMSCEDLAKSFLFLAKGGRTLDGERILGSRETKRVNALMQTCGTYDAVGDFAFRVGIPAKSGVGGGIVGVIPKQMTVAVWSPELNNQGNSVLGSKALELFTTYTGISIF